MSLASSMYFAAFDVVCFYFFPFVYFDDVELHFCWFLFVQVDLMTLDFSRASSLCIAIVSTPVSISTFFPHLSASHLGVVPHANARCPPHMLRMASVSCMFRDYTALFDTASLLQRNTQWHCISVCMQHFTSLYYNL